jgi:hypothetical protein
MAENTMAALPVILSITAFSVALVAWRAGDMAKAFNRSKIAIVLAHLIGGLIIGFLAVWVYMWMAGHWPGRAAILFRWVALGIAVVLNILVLMMYRRFSKTVVIVLIVLNVVWGVGYGWLLPVVLR